MPAKKKPYLAYATKEEFEKSFQEIFRSGREQGFNEGLAVALSYFYEAEQRIMETFDPMGEHTLGYVANAIARERMLQRRTKEDDKHA